MYKYSIIDFILGNLFMLGLLCVAGIAGCIWVRLWHKKHVAKEMGSTDNDPHY